jgi:hypothetical protein
MAADKHKNQQNAQQGWEQGGRLSNKPIGQPIRNDATQDVRNVAVKPPENFVEQPNKEARRRPQNHQTKTAPPPPQRDGQPQHQQQEQQGKKKKKPEDKPPDQ